MVAPTRIQGEPAWFELAVTLTHDGATTSHAGATAGTLILPVMVRLFSEAVSRLLARETSLSWNPPKSCTVTCLNGRRHFYQEFVAVPCVVPFEVR